MTSRRMFDLWGVPFDGGATLGWPGSRYAPGRVRLALNWMLMRIQQHQIYSNDIGQVLDMPEGVMRDRGDAAVIPHDLMASLDACSQAVTSSVMDGRIPIVIGGDDSLLFACVRGFHDSHEGSIAIVHFDAHLDLLDESPQQGRYSHSSGMRRALELPRLTIPHSIQVGSRNFNFPTSRRFIDAMSLAQMPATDFDELGTQRAVQRIVERISGADHVFWAFDIDVLDPSAAPGAGAHEPGGLTSRQALDCVRLLAQHCEGMCIMEVNPLFDQHDVTSTLAANLAFGFVVYGRSDEDQSPGSEPPNVV